MKLYRAVSKKNFDENQKYYKMNTKRIPSNIHYVVDNILEYLRPETHPNRRHSAYASPTKELALENASSVGFNKDDYIVCEVKFFGDFKICHLNVTDARNHQDNYNIKSQLIKFLGKDFSNLSIEQKLKFSPLFLPSVSKNEIQQFIDNHIEMKSFFKEIETISSFWNDCSLSINNHNGELFFEVLNDGYYQLNTI